VLETLFTGFVGGVAAWFFTDYVAKPLRRFFDLRRQSICAIPPADQPHTDDEPPPPLPPMQKISATIVSSSIFVQTLLNRTAQSVVRWASINKD
jgi:hypothetical protein